MPNHITNVKYFSCGYCVNNLGLVFKNTKSEKRKFPAGAFLIEHAEHGPILFDTGYSVNICQAGTIGKLYNFVNPTTVKKTDELHYQLENTGIKPDDIKTIILSHLHPDHIGGLKDFPKAKFVLSKKALQSYQKKHLKDLIMKDFFPSDFVSRTTVITKQMMNTKVLDGVYGYDFYDDGSIILIELSGHAYGQLCALINHKILLAADSCWGNDLLQKSKKMKFPATLIQDNMKDYNESLETLQEFKDHGIELMFSHDAHDKKELLWTSA